MLTRWLREVIRKELEIERERTIAAMTEAIAANNQQLERDFVRLGFAGLFRNRRLVSKC